MEVVRDDLLGFSDDFGTVLAGDLRELWERAEVAKEIGVERGGGGRRE